MDKEGKPKKGKNFQEVVREFEKYFHDPDHFYKIFSEVGCSNVDDGCDGACDHCEQKAKVDTLNPPSPPFARGEGFGDKLLANLYSCPIDANANH